MVSMEERVNCLHESLDRVMARLDGFPTREEIRAEIRPSEVRIIWWFVGLSLAQAGLTIVAWSLAVMLLRQSS